MKHIEIVLYLFDLSLRLIDLALTLWPYLPIFL